MDQKHDDRSESGGKTPSRFSEEMFAITQLVLSLVFLVGGGYLVSQRVLTEVTLPGFLAGVALILQYWFSRASDNPK